MHLIVPIYWRHRELDVPDDAAAAAAALPPAV